MVRKAVFFAALSAISLSASAQAPSTEAMTLSLKTMSKALAGCRESYTHSSPGTNDPFLRPIVGTDNYDKDLASLGRAERLVNALIADPSKTSGKVLVAILSTSDDFSIGVGSTRAEVLSHMVIDARDASRETKLVVAAEALNNCQKSLFNAGDDFVGFVINYVGTEDDALAARPRSR